MTKFCEQRTSSLSSPDHVKPSLIGFGDTSRDWLLLGRRGSGALELLAGLWRQSRDHSERSSFDASDDHTHSQCKYSAFRPTCWNQLNDLLIGSGLPRQRPSIDSTSSSDGVCSALEEYCHLAGYRIGQRRGSCPADNSSSLGNFNFFLRFNRVSQRHLSLN